MGASLGALGVAPQGILVAPSGGVAGSPVVEWVGPQWWGEWPPWWSIVAPSGGVGRPPVVAPHGGVLWSPVVGVSLGAAGTLVP